MTDIEKKALALLQECGFHGGYIDRKWNEQYEALCRAIEQHEAFQQEVSEALIEEFGGSYSMMPRHMRRFIIAKPDPLVDALDDLKDGRAGSTTESYAACLREALAKRGLQVTEIER